MSDVANKADKAVQPAVKTGMGKIGNWGHPIHPATGASVRVSRSKEAASSRSTESYPE